MSGAQLKVKVQLYCGDEIAMGPGKAALLGAIAATGSISAAARQLGMSYRRAWLLVDAMNRCWREPLVTTSPGGSPRGGARLSAMGAQVLEHYRALVGKLEGAAQGSEWRSLTDAILPQPRLSQKD